MIAPVSGGRFVNQLGELYHLAKYNFVPDIILSGSGGVVASMSYVCAGYKQSGLLRIAKEIHSGMYIKSWAPKSLNFIPPKIFGFFRGSFYDTSELLPMVIKKLITPGLLKEIELWILTFNTSKGEPGLFCSCSEQDAIIQNNDGHLKLYRELVYLDGNLDMFTKVATASASIPSVVPPININGDSYADAGLAHSSPLTPLSIDIQYIDRWHIVYLCCYNIYDIPKSDLDGSILDSFGYAAKKILDSNTQTDRYKCYELLTQRGEVIEEKMDLAEYFKRRDEWHSSFVEIYPLSDKMLELDNYTGEDVANIMLSTDVGITVRYILTKTTGIGVKNWI